MCDMVSVHFSFNYFISFWYPSEFLKIIINEFRTMCKGWILDPVRSMLRTILSQRNCSPLTFHNMINIALFSAQNIYAPLVGLVEGFPWADTVVETVYCKACHYVSQIVFFLGPFPVNHCIGNVEAFLDQVPFPCSSRSSSLLCLCVLQKHLHSQALYQAGFLD